MKKKITIILLFLGISLFLIGCGNDEKFYENVAFEELKTYTEIAETELTKSEDQVDEMLYYYQVNNKDDKTIDLYDSYLIDEYGFTYNTEDSNDEKFVKVYDYKGKRVVFTIKEEDENVYLVIRIPFSEEYLPTSIENNYNLALQNIEDKKYREAFDIMYYIRNTEGYFDYKDAGKVTAYARAMVYKEQRNYGSAIDGFKDADGYKDSNEQLEELRKKVAPYEGTWYYDSPKAPGYGLGYYVFIQDGKVSYEFESSYDSGYEPHYLDSIAFRYNEENEMDEALTLGSIDGLNDDIVESDYEYLLYLLKEDQLMVSGRKTYGTSTFTGVYDRISLETPADN